MGSHEPEVGPQLVGALGATDADLERIRQFANVLDATVQARTLSKEVRRRATRTVYTALVAAIAAGFHLTPATPHAGETTGAAR